MKVLEIAVRAGKSLNFSANCIQSRFLSAYKEQTQKDLQDEIALVVEELRHRHRLKALFFFTEWSPWKIGNVSLKVLEFFVQKRVRTLKFAVLPSVKSV